MRYFCTVAVGDLDASQSPALRKLRLLSHLLRAVSAGYAVWVLWRIVTWWLDADKVRRGYSSSLDRDLSGIADWQRYAALAVDSVAWVLLAMAVAHCWKFLNFLTQATRWNEASRQITHCAWLAIACETITELTRPVQSLLMTIHLSANEQVWKWNFRTVDMLAILFCVALLMFAYVFAWTVEIAEENRSFV
jgi:hypothetical protein